MHGHFYRGKNIMYVAYNSRPSCIMCIIGKKRDAASVVCIFWQYLVVVVNLIPTKLWSMFATAVPIRAKYWLPVPPPDCPVRALNLNSFNLSMSLLGDL